MSIYCNRCGASNADGTYYCTSCGSRLEADPAEVNAQDTAAPGEGFSEANAPEAGGQSNYFTSPEAESRGAQNDGRGAYDPRETPGERPAAEPGGGYTPPDSYYTPPNSGPDYGYGYQQGYGAQPPADVPPGPGSYYSVMSVLAYIGSFIVLAIPVAGFIVGIVWACGGSKKKNRVNLARAYLILAVIGGILLIVFGAAIGSLFAYSGVFEDYYPENYRSYYSSNGGDYYRGYDEGYYTGYDDGFYFGYDSGYADGEYGAYDASYYDDYSYYFGYDYDSDVYDYVYGY